MTAVQSPDGTDASQRSTRDEADARAAGGPPTSASWLTGGGEMGERVRAFDWEATSLGPAESWPQSLRSAVSILLPSRAQIVLFWGADLIAIYNDAYRPTFGAKHPWALGRPARDCWRELWDVLEPLFAGVMRTGEAFWASDHLFYLERHGYSEETYFDVSYDPVRDESGGVGGIFCIVSETTGRVLGARRLRTLRELDAQLTGPSDESICQKAAQILAGDPADVPFALLFLFDAAGDTASLVSVTGIDASQVRAGIELQSSAAAAILREAARGGRAIDASPDAFVLGAPGIARADHVLAVPLSAGTQVAGVIVAGLSRHLALTDEYRGYFDLVAGCVAGAIANRRAYHEERRRAEALAELDRAKTTFFGNVSHEFRTPLTLMLGPLSDLLDGAHGELAATQREQVAIVQRSALRLLKLVNTLLDFARLEAGRARAVFEPVDLAELTRNVAGVFRSAIERAGLTFDVDCPALPEPVHVDRDLWERIVLNLLSNALKFTFEGRIGVSLRREGDVVELSVSDTGGGIPADELPHVFTRFHRVTGTRARSHEGSGIGLALVHELAQLHGGGVSVESEIGRGTTFRVTVRTGTAHLGDHPATARDPSQSGVAARAFVEEALSWLPEPNSGAAVSVGSAAPRTPGDRARILVVDDNADMRAYLKRLLSERWDVETAPDGAVALERVQVAPPDLVLTDVMMPDVDGFALLRALRSQESTRELPVIMLSARAGEEAQVEGLDAGADDYLVKPFSARELVARVRSQLALAAARRQAEAANRAKDEFLAMLGHELRNPLAPITTALELMKLRGGDHLARERTVIQRQVKHLVTLVDDLLDVARVARGKVQLRRKRIDFAEVVAKAIEIASPLLEERRHELATEVAPGLTVDGDELRLVQVLANLLTNAARYTEPGGSIVVTAAVEGQEVVASVRDNGIGISAELAPRLFDLFVQGSRPQGGQAGLGLGLSLVRSLVELHGGSVSVRSEGAGRGSEFTVRLPRAPGRAEPVAESTRGFAAHLAGGAVRLLVVDDNRDAAETLGHTLGELGYDARVAFDGPTALELARSFSPHVALVDIGMPVMSGYELAHKLREVVGGMRLVAVTGYGQRRDRVLVQESGFDLHLVKPLDLALLTEQLRVLLAEK